MINKIALRNIFRNKRRTALTLMVIAIGVCVILLALAYIEYIRWGLGESTIHTDTGHFQVMNKKFAQSEESRILEFGIADWEPLLCMIESVPEIEVVTPRIHFSGLISNGEKSSGILVAGIDPVKEMTLRGIFGDGKSFQNLSQNPNGVLLGKGLAKSLKVKRGDLITILATAANGALNAMDFEVVDELSTGTKELDKRFAVISIGRARELLITRKVERLVIGLYETEDQERIQELISAQLPDSLVIKNWKELAVYYKKVLRFFYQIIGFMAPMIMIIVWFSVMNTILMTVLERNREFATLCAMGTPHSLLTRMLLTEGFWLGVFGISLGIILELLLSHVINHVGIVLPPPPGQSVGHKLMVRNIWIDFLLVGLVTNAIVMLSAVLPGMRIRKINIANTLRG